MKQEIFKNLCLATGPVLLVIIAFCAYRIRKKQKILSFEYHKDAIKTAVMFSTLFGIILVALFLMFTATILKYDFKNIENVKSYPWTLITALAAAPTTLLLMAWERVQKRTEIADQRFDKAAAQLSEPNKSFSRIGGIYALERLSKENNELTQSIVELICAFLRTRNQGETKEEKLERKICTDILSRLWQKNWRNWDYSEKLNPDLRDANFKELVLYGIDLKTFFLKGANFTGATIDGSNFQNCFLDEADFTKTRMISTSFKYANLKNCKGLTQEQINETRGTLCTELPEGIIKPKQYYERANKCNKCEKRLKHEKLREEYNEAIKTQNELLKPVNC